MTVFDLFFIISVLFVLIWCSRLAYLGVTRRWSAARTAGQQLLVFIALYCVALVAFSLLSPRRIYSAGEPRCFDDWCVAAISASPAPAAVCIEEQRNRVWLARLEVSSVAKGVRQRARDARAELEDRQGRRYAACNTSFPSVDAARQLSDELGPGESFAVTLAFSLPSDAVPVGIVFHHGDFPGSFIIGEDQSFLHTPALLRLEAGTHVGEAAAKPDTMP